MSTNRTKTGHTVPVVLGLVSGEESLGDLHGEGELGAGADQHEGGVGQAVLRAAHPLLGSVATQRSLLVAGAYVYILDWCMCDHKDESIRTQSIAANWTTVRKKTWTRTQYVTSTNKNSQQCDNNNQITTFLPLM